MGAHENSRCHSAVCQLRFTGSAGAHAPSGVPPTRPVLDARQEPTQRVIPTPNTCC